ncbi:aldehyde dehydrogenase family protein [Microbacterium aurantiacum]|uniref:aldehyde dehydrogenase family protein n=1 Tax=Microbacterium aurantiacum TaxID=162393 RepID=UPI001F19D968|nr:aldehyde dehydrogenase family protein [Microbacterium aurantiacum]
MSDVPQTQARPDAGVQAREWSPDEIGAAFERQRRAFLAEGPPSLAVRRDRLDRLILLLTENAQEFGEAMDADFGHRPASVSTLTDITGILLDIEIIRRRLGAWSRPKRPLAALRPFGLAAKVERVPLGVVGVIGPWNFPLGLVAQPAAAALAGGNRVMVKFSEITPRTGALFAAKVAEFFGPDEMIVVTGGSEAGATFSALAFDHLFFTGSPKVGALVAQAAGRNLVPVTLELGGKNPVVVAEGADVAVAAEKTMAGRLMNGGQVCLCPEVVYVPESVQEQFLARALRRAREIWESEDGPVTIVNDANFARVCALVEDARAKGAEVHEAVPGAVPDAASRRIPPVVVTGVTADMDIDSEEIFGPVLMMRTYRSMREVVEDVAGRPSPLAAYWFGPRGEDFAEFTARTRFGGMTVDDIALHVAVPGLPFGGVGQSGSGAYHGRAGFDTFTHARPTVRTRLRISMGEALNPPFTQTRGISPDRMLAKLAQSARRRVFGRGRN